MPHAKSNPSIPPTSDCTRCDGRCCRYIATELDRPRGKRDYDNIRWFLLHRNVSVYVDRDRQWFIEFQTPCRELQPDNRCGRYAARPRICRNHNTGDEACERYDPEPYRICFHNVHQFEAYLEQRGIDWRFKTPAEGNPR